MDDDSDDDSSTSSTSTSFNPAGWFKMLEIVLGILVFALIAGQGHPYSSAMKYVLFVSITCWILTLVLAVFYMCAVLSIALVGAPWNIIEFVFNTIWAFFYFIAAIVATTSAGGIGRYIAATVFAFFITAVYVMHARYAYRTFRDDLPCTTSNTGNNVDFRIVVCC